MVAAPEAPRDEVLYNGNDGERIDRARFRSYKRIINCSLEETDLRARVYAAENK